MLDFKLIDYWLGYKALLEVGCSLSAQQIDALAPVGYTDAGAKALAQVVSDGALNRAGSAILAYGRLIRADNRLDGIVTPIQLSALMPEGYSDVAFMLIESVFLERCHARSD